MPDYKSKTLRLDEMILNRQGTFVRRFVHGIVSISLRLFFRRIETVNAASVPVEGPLIFVLNHPNGLVDPSLVFVALPRRISFLAKSTLFKMPVVGSILRMVEALPVYRKIDSADVSKNRLTFVECNKLLRKGGAIALFPEGVSHNSPKLLPIKTGAARIALGAISGVAGNADFKLTIVPVGLYYTNKTTFRSEALLHFGTPFEVKPPKLNDEGDLVREDVRQLNEQIEKALRDVTLNAESDAQLEQASESANLFFSVSDTLDFEESIAERFEFVRRYIETSQSESEKDKSLTSRVSEYKKRLRELGLEPENLSLANEPAWYVFRKFVLRMIALIVLAPLWIAGTILHFPPYQVSKLIASRYTHHGVDDIISTVKIMSGVVFMPVTWIVAAAAVFYFSDSFYALFVIPVSLFLGYVALRTWEEYAELRGWLRAAWLFFTKRKMFIELIRERRKLHGSLDSLND